MPNSYLARASTGKPLGPFRSSSASRAKHLAGNAPFIVNRHTGVLQATGTALPIEQYIAQYEAHLAAGRA
jgi:hypothetical protein